MDIKSLNTDNYTSELGELCDKLAEKICARGLALPGIFILEMYKPLSSVMSAGITVAAPLLVSLFGAKWYPVVTKLLESRQAVERLIRAIERREESKQNESSGSLGSSNN